MTIPTGACYLLNHGVSDRHYFFVISAPDKYPERPLVLVSITSVSPDKNIDRSCLVSPGEHPCCTKESFVYYKGALMLTAAKLGALIATGDATPKPPAASPTLLQRLRDGAEASEPLI